MRILIVEDEIRIREGIRKLLLKIDSEYEVAGEAGDGQEGLELCRKLEPDLIITDVQMPKMDGLHMLEKVYEEGFTTKAIVLSAYSEFEYARGAMKLGVTEYLLKPINLSEFAKALENIKRQILEDQRRKPDKVGTLDQILRELIAGRLTVDEDTKSYLYNHHHILAEQNFVLIVAYIGNQYRERAQSVKTSLGHSLSLYEGIDFCSLEIEYLSSVLSVVYNCANPADLERWVQYQLLNSFTDHAAIGYTVAQSLTQMKTGLEELFPFMDWNLSFEDSVLISYPKITQVQTSLCVYPQDLEVKMKSAICAADHDKEKSLLRSFSEYFMDGKVYDPHEIKESYVRFIWAVIETAKGVGNTGAGKIKQQKLLEMIMNAKMREELSAICDRIAETLDCRESEDDSDNLTIRRAKSMIGEFYHTGITLDEIASRLNITPEYLGTQFHKETGVTFSAYIKDYRIRKAKELLIGTSLKLYEIADRVGYSDPKYFSKVFRDTTGQLPADYRKAFK
ncbi:MAG: response regulator [Lachnospiraceae bacterium]|nr:response regulator [Lachnospiraceae bacterium]